MADEAEEAVVAAVRDVVRAGQIDRLVIDDLTMEDLDRIEWSGSQSHIRHVRAALGRVASGEVEYLVVRTPDGSPVAKGGIDYAAHPGMGTIWQLATHPRLQSLGLGTRLIAEAERRIVRRGLPWVVLAVEDANPRARALYERLGYRFWTRRLESWQVEGADGEARLYESEVAVLRKRVT
jgi:ribosomal protein S18 acetylase RimI-like enzyme